MRHGIVWSTSVIINQHMSHDITLMSTKMYYTISDLNVHFKQTEAKYTILVMFLSYQNKHKITTNKIPKNNPKYCQLFWVIINEYLSHGN